MRLLQISALFSLVLLVSACAAPQTQQEYAERVRQFDSRFDAVIRHEGPSVSGGAIQFGGVWGLARLRTVVHKETGHMAHQLYADLAYDGRRFRWFESANLEGGQRRQLRELDHERLNCNKDKEPRPCRYSEVVGLELTLDFLLAHQTEGFSVRMNAREGSTILFTIPPHFVRGQLQAVGVLPPELPSP